MTGETSVMSVMDCGLRQRDETQDRSVPSRLDRERHGEIGVATGPFPRHFGARLVAERRRSRRPLWVVATCSKGDFTLRDLRDVEAGLLPLDAATVVRLADLYGIRVREALPPMRHGLEIDDASLCAGGVSVAFRPGDARSMVDAYFRLARTLRSIGDETARVGFRHDDLEELVQHLRGSDHSTRYLASVLAMATAERRVVVGGLLAGAAALDLAGPNGPGGDDGRQPGAPGRRTAQVAPLVTR